MNQADREALLRIPGIGARSVGRILSLRKYRQLRISDLKKLRVAWNRAASFIQTSDHNPGLKHLDKLALRERFRPKEKQLLLFDAADSAAVGEL